MGGVLGRVGDSYNDSDDEVEAFGVELVDANGVDAPEVAIEMPNVENAAPGSVSPLMFGGNVFPNGNPSDPMQELMLPLLRRLARNTAQISQTRTVLCPFNINKDSIKLVPRVTTSNSVPSSTIYDVQFTFDATEACIVKVFLCVDEVFSNGSFEYLASSNGSRVGCVPSNVDLAGLSAMGSHSSSSSPQVLIEKRFEAGLGQVFFTIGAEALDISQFSISNLTWNQLEQQLDADRAFARSGDANSDGSNSDGEANENEEEEENNDEERANESGSDDEPTLEVIDEEAGIAAPSRHSSSTREERRARRRDARQKKKKSKLAALPRPRKSMDEPLVVRNLYPIVVAIEPTITAENIDKKPVVEAQITHACLYPSSTSAPSSAAPTPSIEVELVDPNVATSSSATAASSSSASPEPSSSSSASSSSDANTKYEARVLRQKLLVNGSVYNVYDIFGVEADDPSVVDSDIQASCVICMSEPRTTIVMPCRHMCLCEGCAESLKVQSVKCPICRGPVRGLLKVDVGPEEDGEDAQEGEDGEDDQGSPANINRNARLPARRERRQVDSDSDEELRSDDDGESAANSQPLRLVDSDADVAEVSGNIRRLRSYAESEEDDEDDDNVHASLVKGAK